jgi:hypothetical protein
MTIGLKPKKLCPIGQLLCVREGQVFQGGYCFVLSIFLAMAREELFGALEKETKILYL